MNPDVREAELLQKLEKCVSDSWKNINEELKTYQRVVQQGSECIALLIAHKTTFKNVSKAKLDGTSLITQDSQIYQKLIFCIQKALYSEEIALVNILNDLQSSYVNIMTQVEKVSNVYSSCNLSINELTKGSEMSLPLIEKLQSLEDFGRLFSQDHMKRKCSRDIHILSEDLDKLADFWKISFIKTLQMRMNWRLGTEDSLSENTIILLPEYEELESKLLNHP